VWACVNFENLRHWKCPNPTWNVMEGFEVFTKVLWCLFVFKFIKESLMNLIYWIPSGKLFLSESIKDFKSKYSGLLFII